MTSGSTPRSLRLPASEVSLWRLPVRNIEVASQWAASTSTEVVVDDISVVSPPMTPPRPMMPESSVTTRSSTDSARSTPSRVVSRSPACGAADPDRALQLVGVVAVDRAADLEHDVVGDVDGQRDRAHPRLGEPADHPVGRGRGRVEAGDLAGHEDRAAGRVVDLDRVAVAVGLGHVALGRVAEGRVVGQRGLAGDPTQGQRVGAVGVDLELDDLVAAGRAPRTRRRRADPHRRGAR